MVETTYFMLSRGYCVSIEIVLCSQYMWDVSFYISIRYSSSRREHLLDSGTHWWFLANLVFFWYQMLEISFHVYLVYHGMMSIKMAGMDWNDQCCIWNKYWIQTQILNLTFSSSGFIILLEICFFFELSQNYETRYHTLADQFVRFWYLFGF